MEDMEREGSEVSQLRRSDMDDLEKRARLAGGAEDERSTASVGCRVI